MAQTEEQTTNQTENILQNIDQADLDRLDKFGFDIKNLTSVLASLQLFRDKDAKKETTQAEKTKQEDDKVEATSPKSAKTGSSTSRNEPRLIGAVKSKKPRRKNRGKNKNKISPKTSPRGGGSSENGENKTKQIASPIQRKGSSADISPVTSSSEAQSTASSSKGSKRGSRGNRRARRRRVAKKKLAEKLADLGLALRPEESTSDATTEGTRKSIQRNRNKPKTNSKNVVAPPPEFYKYPDISPKRDVLRDPVTGENRPVWCVTVPLVCHETNTPFYAQCSTSKQGYCTRCGVLRKGHQKTGSVCTEQGCNERLTAKYHRWFPGLIRLEPYGKERKAEDYVEHKDLLKQFGISWNSEDELKFVVNHYLLLKVFVVSPDFDVAPLHLERTYMIGVFAGRAFQTGALARKFLRDGLKLMSFRADYPSVIRLMANYRANIVEELNQIFFQGRFRCYFHAHQTNIEGWYDPTQVDPSTIKAYFKEICDRHISAGGLKEKERKKKARHQSSKFSNMGRVAYPKNPGRFDFIHSAATSTKKNSIDSNDRDSDKGSDKLIPIAPPGFESRKSSKSSTSKLSKKSSSSKKRKSKKKSPSSVEEVQPQISYVPIYFTPQPMMAPNGQPMMMAAPQGYTADPRVTGGFQYAPISYAMPQAAPTTQSHVAPNSYYTQAPQYYSNSGGSDNYSYAAPAYNYGYSSAAVAPGYGYSYGTASPSESSANGGTEIGGANTPQFVPAGYGQPVDIPAETQPGAQALNKPIYPTHFVPVDASNATTTEKK